MKTPESAEPTQTPSEKQNKMRNQVFLFLLGAVAVLSVVYSVKREEELPKGVLINIDPAAYDHFYFISGVVAGDRLSEKYKNCKTVILYPGMYNDSRYGPEHFKIRLRKKIEGVFVGAKSRLDVLAVTPIRLADEIFFKTVNEHPDCQLVIFVNAGAWLLDDFEKKNFPENFPDIALFHSMISFGSSKKITSTSLQGTPFSCVIEEVTKTEYRTEYFKLEKEWMKKNRISYRKYNAVFNSTNKIIWRDD